MKLHELHSGGEENSTTAFYIGLSDLMVLLLVFFLMLVSMSKIDKGSFEKIRVGFTGSTKGTLVELAGHLGVETVAEWVDDEMQASMLRDWGVTYLQGHLVGRAETVEPPQVAPRRLAAG